MSKRPLPVQTTAGQRVLQGARQMLPHASTVVVESVCWHTSMPLCRGAGTAGVMGFQKIALKNSVYHYNMSHCAGACGQLSQMYQPDLPDFLSRAD